MTEAMARANLQLRHGLFFAGGRPCKKPCYHEDCASDSRKKKSIIETAQAPAIAGLLRSPASQTGTEPKAHACGNLLEQGNSRERAKQVPQAAAKRGPLLDGNVDDFW
jgi:hypothetical protein